MSNINCDVSKEFLTFLYFFDEDIIKNIPTEFIKLITRLSAGSSKQFYIEKGKDLFDQNMSSSCKNLFMYIYNKYLKTE